MHEQNRSKVRAKCSQLATPFAEQTGQQNRSKMRAKRGPEHRTQNTEVKDGAVYHHLSVCIKPETARWDNGKLEAKR